MAEITVGKLPDFATLRGPNNGDRSSMVELQIVVLAVAGSSPVGHPIPLLDGWGWISEAIRRTQIPRP